MSQAKLREALTAGASSTKDKGPPVADGSLTVTPDTPEAIEWRSRQSVIDGIASSSSYLEEDNEGGHQPSSVYGKFTWKLDNFNEISKRELRSAVFEVGSYKWYILVYPHGCDVANHLSLFLCVADYDKLLPGWQHFAQFTIAVVNKDPKRSKYSDTLHRFCKKEHDWGWKKFMELGKVAEGFTVGDSLVIKAQVQVITDRPARPFRTLDPQYRRELARVYLTNVEGIVRRFLEEQIAAVRRILDPSRGFLEWWDDLEDEERDRLACAPAPTLLKGLVKRFFNEKEVTSTLVMDALYCGVKALEVAHRRGGIDAVFNEPLPSITVVEEGSSSSDKDDKDNKGNEMTVPAPPARPASGIVIDAAAQQFVFANDEDVIDILQRLVDQPLPATPPDKPGEPPALRSGSDIDNTASSRDSVERDERRLAELGRRAAEMYVAGHIVETRLATAWAEAETIKRQEELIREEEEANKGEAERLAARAEVDREKKARKKERQRLKKEAERVKREAQEAEKLRVETERKADADRKHKEAEDRRLKEEAERTRQAEARRIAESKRQAEAAAAKATKAKNKAKTKEEQNKPTQNNNNNNTASNSATPSESSNDDGAASSAMNSARSDRSGGPTVVGYPPPREGIPLNSRGSTPALGDDDSLNSNSTAAAADAQPSRPTHGSSIVESLRKEVGRLSFALGERDAEVASMRLRIADLEGQLSSLGIAPPSSSPSVPVSRAGSATFSQQRASSAGSEGDGLNSKAPPNSTANSGAAGENGYGHSGVSRSQYGGGPRASSASGVPSNTSSPADGILASACMTGGGGSGRRGGGSAGNGAVPQRQGSAPAAGAASRPGSAQHMNGNIPSPSPQTSAPRFASGYSSKGFGGKHHQQQQQQVPSGVQFSPGSYRSAAAAHAATGGSSSQDSPEGIAGASVIGATAAATQSGGDGGGSARARAYSSPLPNNNNNNAKRDGVVLESPGLDDFAHMGLITDLLE